MRVWLSCQRISMEQTSETSALKLVTWSVYMHMYMYTINHIVWHSRHMYRHVHSLGVRTYWSDCYVVE